MQGNNAAKELGVGWAGWRTPVVARTIMIIAAALSPYASLLHYRFQHCHSCSAYFI